MSYQNWEFLYHVKIYSFKEGHHRMGFFKKKEGSIISDYFKPLHDIGTLKKELMVEVALYNDHLEMTYAGAKKDADKVSLAYSKITDVFYGFSGELIQKQKSVIGRAAVGGLLFGGLGAVVGAVSGTGTKEAKDPTLYFIISYTDSEGNEQYLEFKDTRQYRGRKVAKTLKELTNTSSFSPTEIEL